MHQFYSSLDWNQAQYIIITTIITTTTTTTTTIIIIIIIMTRKEKLHSCSSVRLWHCNLAFLSNVAFCIFCVLTVTVTLTL